MVSAIKASLKPEGRLVIVEYRQEDETSPISDGHRMSERQIRYEIESLGFEWRETRDVLPRQHVMIFSLDQAEAIQ